MAVKKYGEAVLDEIWRRLPGKSPLRQAAAVLACGTHHRLGRVSPLRALAELPEMVYAIMRERMSMPIVVPDDCYSLNAAICEASAMQTIVVRAGAHSLVLGQGMPTRVDKPLHIVGEPGAVLVGGLHMGMDSSGTLTNVQIQGHLWCYDGLWEITACSISNRNQDAAVVVSNCARAHFKECDIGGVSRARSYHGVIQYGDSLLCLESCEIFHSRLAVSLGNECRCYLLGCDLTDCDVVFACMQGDTGIHLEVEDCEIARSGVVWKDGRRPPNVISRGNTVNRASIGRSYWTASSPWGGWESLPHPSEMIADGEYVIGAEEEMFSGLTLQEVAVLHPEAIAMDCS